MPNVASVLKSEISRVARKEVRGETVPLRKAVSAYRSEIAALKRRAQTIEQALRRLSSGHAKPAPTVAVEQDTSKFRFQCEGSGLTAPAPWPFGGPVRPSGRCFGSIDLQLGAGQDATVGEALSGYSGRQRHE